MSSTTSETPAATTTSSAASSTTPSSEKIVVHWLDNSRAQRVLWLLEELGLEYEIKPYKRVNMLAPPELKEVHPLGKSPVVTIGSHTTLAESGYIFEYLIETYGSGTSLRPKNPADYQKYKYFLHFAEGSLMPPLIIGFILKNIKNASVPFFIKPITNAIVGRVHTNYLDGTYAANFGYLEKTLEDNKDNGGWFVGNNISGADIILSFPLDAAGDRAQGFNKEAYPRIFEWLAKIKERPAYKKAMEKTKAIDGNLF